MNHFQEVSGCTNSYTPQIAIPSPRTSIVPPSIMRPRLLILNL